MRFHLAVLLLTACQSAEVRCHDISLQSLQNRMYEQNEEKFLERLTRQRDYSERFANELTRRQMHREVRAKMSSTGDSSDPKPVPPPKPSELRWYEEYCFKGEPR